MKKDGRKARQEKYSGRRRRRTQSRVSAGNGERDDSIKEMEEKEPEIQQSPELGVGGFR